MFGEEYKEYLPTGPSDSAAIRDIADRKYQELLTSVEEGINRNQFIAWSNDITKELLGGSREPALTYKETGVAKSATHHRIYGEFDKDMNLGKLITEDMKIPSQTGLDKLKKIRQQLELYMNPRIETPASTIPSSSHEHKSQTSAVYFESTGESSSSSSPSLPPSPSPDSLLRTSQVSFNPTSTAVEIEVDKPQESPSPEILRNSSTDTFVETADQVKSHTSFISVKENVMDEGNSMRSSSDGVDMSGDWKNVTTGALGGKWGLKVSTSVGGGRKSSDGVQKQRVVPSSPDADLSGLTTDGVKALLSRKFL